MASIVNFVRRGYLRVQFLLPLYLQNLMNYTALRTGIILAPRGERALVSPFSGIIADRIGPRFPLFSEPSWWLLPVSLQRHLPDLRLLVPVLGRKSCAASDSG